jgi:hypothetical protein
MSSLQQNRRKGQNKFCLDEREDERREKGQGVEMAQTMYAHMNE